MGKFTVYLLIGFIGHSLLTSCVADDAPPVENEEEVIDSVRLTFTPATGGTPVIATASDPDGEGPGRLVANGPISLSVDTEYTLAIQVGSEITLQIREEDDEHQFFFAWKGTAELFSNPAGDGNEDNRDDPVNYIDFDDNGQPVGLTTTWTTTSRTGKCSFRVTLKHQPGIKSDTSTVTDGETDVSVEWSLTL